MKYILNIISLFLFSFLPLLSQGFDWQFSPRMPTDYPDFYIGATAEADFLNHDIDFKFFENTVICERFTDNGSGSGYNVGISAEYWKDGDIAFFGRLAWFKKSAEFKVKSAIPRVTGDFLSEYSFNSELSFFGLEAGAKIRLLGSHFHAGATVNGSYLLSNINTYKEKILSPNDYFSTDPPTQERLIAKGEIASLQNFQFFVKLRLGYDVQMGKGTYSTFFIAGGLPLTNVLSNDVWRIWSISLGITILKGFHF